MMNTQTQTDTTLRTAYAAADHAARLLGYRDAIDEALATTRARHTAARHIVLSAFVTSDLDALFGIRKEAH
jgi:hypothetical protein